MTSNFPKKHSSIYYVNNPLPFLIIFTLLYLLMAQMLRPPLLEEKSSRPTFESIELFFNL